MEPKPDSIPIFDPQAIDWEEIERLRKITGSQKVLMGLRLQELARTVTLAGIRHQHPDADEQEIHRLYIERISKRR